MLRDPIADLAKVNAENAQAALERALEQNRELMAALQKRMSGYRNQAQGGNVQNWGLAGDVEHINQTLRHLTQEG